MAGIQAGGGAAGRLSIEIVAEVARLQADMDKVRRLVKDASGDIAKNARYANDNLAGMSGGFNKASGASRQFSMQMSQVGQQVMAGTGVVQALAMQLPDIAVGFASAGAGASRFAAFLGGPLGIGITTAISLSVAFIPQLLGIGASADTAKNKIEGLTQAYRNLAAAQGAATNAQLFAAMDEQARNRQRLQLLLNTGHTTRAGRQRSDETNEEIQQLKEYLSSSDAVIAGTRMRIAAQQKLNKLHDEGVASAKAHTQAERDAAREAKESTREALKAQKEWSALMAGASAWGSLGDRLDRSREELARASGELLSKTEGIVGYKFGSSADPVTQMLEARYGALNALVPEADTAATSIDGLAQSWRSLANILDQVAPGLGDVAALLNGLSTGDFASMGGKIGGALSLVKMGTGDKGWEEVTKKLDTIFGGSGSFSKTMTGLMRGAGIGSAASQLLGGSGGAGSMIGGAIGGKLGEKLGDAMAKSTSKFLKGLGDFAGPLGAIAGGVLGDLLGGVFKGKPALGATVITSTTGADAGAWGRKGGLEGATAMGNGVQEALTQLIGALGGKAGDFRVGLGNVEWNGQTYYRVSANGKYNVGDKDYYRDGSAAGDSIYDGTDAAEAVRIAVLNAIEDGAIQGISEGAKRLLLAGNDLQTALNKALQFQSVFTELKQATDPTGYALDQLAAKFDALRLTFSEAGATADEMAKLEQLLAIQRKDIMDDAAKKELDALNEMRAMQVKLLEAQGKDAAALALAREIELSGTADALKDLQKQVYVAQDAQEAAKAAEQLSDAWKSVGDSITEEIRRIRGLTDAGTSKGFASLQGDFNAAMAAARAGNMDTAKLLPGLSKDLLDAAALVATSRQELDRVRAQTAAALESLVAAGAGESIASTDTTAALIAAATPSASSNTGPANADLLAEMRAMRAEMERMRSEAQSAAAAIASNTGKTARILDDVSGQSGGTAISIASAA